VLIDTPFAELARTARSEFIERAAAYSAEYRNIESVSADGDCKIIVSGHQPQLFHPGVWFKNFLLSRLAEEHRAIGINLIVDNDLMQSPTLKVPSGTINEPTYQSVAYDAHSAAIPFEERAIQNVEQFVGFGSAVAQTTSGLVPNPIVNQLWKYAIAATKRTSNLGECISQARHTLEGEWGLNTLELPLSHVVDSNAFAQFAAKILTSIESFGAAYNDYVREYRSVHRIRSQAHPVPLLARPETHDGWFEAPFWLWNTSDPQRRAVEVRIHPDRLELRPRGSQATFRMDIHSESRTAEISRCFIDLRSEGWKLRPRALMTTMFARLFLSDLFIHGIGGSKYDQLTDALIESFFGITPPTFLTATATIKLPIARAPIEADDIRQVEGLIRELHFHPDRNEPDVVRIDAEQFEELVKQKKKLIGVIPPKRQKKNWNNELQKLNERLREYVSQSIQTLSTERERLVSELRKDSLLSSRENSFCLFPDKSLRQTLLDLSRPAP
jgi:hypothetical protein